MNIDYYILAFSAITVVVTIWMGFRSAKTSKTASDFFVAGRSVSVGWNASAISGEYLSAASFMGIAGMVMSSGYDALWYPVCYACGYLFLLLFIAGPLRRFGAYTIPDFAEGRFDSPLFRKIAVCFVLFIGFFYTMPQMKGAGTTLAYIFPGLPYWAGVVLVGAVITLNVALGGMKGITLVQAFQYWAKMFAISVPIFVLMAVYGHYGKQLEMNQGQLELTPNLRTAGWRELLNDNPQNTNIFLLHETTAALAPFSGGQLALKSIIEPIAPGTVGVTNEVWGIAARKPGQGPIMIATVAKLYGELLNKNVSVASTATNLQKGIEWPIVGLSGYPFKVWLESELRASGLTKVTETARSIVFADPVALSTSKRSFPEKAPADSTRLASSATPLDTDLFIEIPSAREFHNQTLRQVNDQLPPANLSGQVDSIVNDVQTRMPTSFAFEPASQSIRGIQGLLAHYSDAAGAKVLLFKELSGVPVQFAPGARLSSNEFIKLADLVLSTNNASVVRHDADTLLVVPSEQVAAFSSGVAPQFRKPLPEKAPKDETWLSPFGPLTTKAAKAAKLSPEEAKPYSLLYTYSLIIALVCGTAGLPHILVRFYTNPDGGAAKRTTMWVMILIGIFYVFPPVFGVMGRNLFPELYSGIGAKGTDKIVLELPRLLNEKYAPLGSILSGITCAGAFAAFMSTFSGLLVSMTGALAHDVYGRMLRPKSTPEQRMRMFKFAAVLIGFVSILLGSLVEPLEINFMVGQAFAIAAASYFPLLFMSVWWRGMTMRGAAVGMLTGGLCALAAATLTNVSNLALDKGPMGKIFSGFASMNDFWAHHPLLRILCEQPAIWTVPLAIILMIVVSKVTRKDVPSDVRMKMLVLHAPEKLGLKQEYIQEHQGGGH